MNKKGDISLQVIVVAILALLVLVILSVMFITKMGAVGENVDTCPAKGGVCKATCGEYETALPFVQCGEGQRCCAGRNTAQQGGGSGDTASQIAG